MPRKKNEEEEQSSSAVTLDSVLAKAEKASKGAITVQDLDDGLEAERVLCGLPSIDFVTDGGFPKGRIIRLCGVKSSGKSTLAIMLAPLFGDKIVYFDTEHTTTTSYTQGILNKQKTGFKVVKSQSVEYLMNTMRAVAPVADVIIWDSLQNIGTTEEVQKGAEEASRASRAKILAQQLPLLIYELDKSKCTLIVVSQVSQNQERITPYDPKYIATGGEKLDHNSSMTLWMHPSSTEKGDKDDLMGKDEIIGRDVRIVCEKNKVGIPLRAVKTRFVYNKGFTVADDVFFAAKKLGIIGQSGSMYYYKGETLARGERNARDILIDNEELLNEIKKEVYDTYILRQKEYTTSEDKLITES